MPDNTDCINGSILADRNRESGENRTAERTASETSEPTAGFATHPSEAGR